MTSASSQYASASGTGTGGRTERGDDAVLAPHVVRGGQHAVQRRSAHDQLATVGVAHARGDVRLPADDDLGGERRAVSGSAVGGPARERLEVDPGRRAAHRLSAREVRRPTLGDRGDAFLEVGGLAESLLLAVLSRRSRRAPGRRGRRASSRGSRAARAAPTRRSPPRTRARPMRSSSAATRRSASPMRNASSPRTSTAVYMSSSACCWPDDRGQRGRDAEALVEPELGEVAAEAGLGRRDAEVGGEREPEAAAHRGALHRGDDRLAVREEARRLLVEAWRWRRAGRCPSGRRRRRSSCPRSTGRRRGTRVRRRAPSTASASSVITVDVEPVVRRTVDLDRRDVVGEVDGDGPIGGSVCAHRRGTYLRCAWRGAAAGFTNP